MNDVRAIYEDRFRKALMPLAGRLEALLKDHLKDVPHIDQITARAKSVDRFVAKAHARVDGKNKYDDPLEQIQDQLGARIVTFYLDDVDRVATTVKEYFRAIEDRDVNPESEKEFDYVGKHFVFFIPSDLVTEKSSNDQVPRFFELQIKTLFQHAWSEANHDLGYKTNGDLDSHQKRRIAFTSAQAWGADLIFNQLYNETSTS